MAIGISGRVSYRKLEVNCRNSKPKYRPGIFGHHFSKHWPAVLLIPISYYTAQTTGAQCWTGRLESISMAITGSSVGDINNDGFDDLYICQPAGLPNRLYRNRGDGTFEDITEASNVGLLDNTSCALFVDLDNDGRQDLIVVLPSGPSFFSTMGEVSSA